MTPNECSGRTLAFLGDAVWSLCVREYLLEKGEGKGSQLQKKSISFVSAKAQCMFYETLHEQGFFTNEEEEYFRRGRNGNAGTVPRNTDVKVYRISTGFEALLGALWLLERRERIREIWDKVKDLREEKA